MEPYDYVERINIDIYYYTQIHRRPPVKIFISSELLDKLDALYIDGETTMCGIPVQRYYSHNLEYYLSSAGFEFNE